MKDDMIKFVPLGGLGEIGMNSMAIETVDGVFLVDNGCMFPHSSDFGIDLIIPDFEYLRTNKERFKAIFITHGHLDHIGALGYLLREFDVPVYCPPFAYDIIKRQLGEIYPQGKKKSDPQCRL